MVIKELKRGKACGFDGIVNEIVKFGGELMEESVWRLCQAMFVFERIPRDWARGIIFPIYKEGDDRVPENYRGITLLSVVGKIYAAVITKRVSTWCEDSKCLSEEQAGFRPGRSPLDHIFTLSECCIIAKIIVRIQLLLPGHS